MTVNEARIIAGRACTAENCEIGPGQCLLSEAIERAFSFAHGDPGVYISRASEGYGELWIAGADGYEVGAYSLDSLIAELCSIGVPECNSPKQATGQGFDRHLS